MKHATHKSPLPPVSWFLSALLVVTLAACSAPGLLPVAPETTPSDGAQVAAVTEVQFVAHVPGDVENLNVTLELLDEVTGLALNPSRIGMQLDEERGRYTVSVPAAVGSVIKYRYLRMGENRANEVTAANLPVRYRMAAVTGPALVIRDEIAGWSDQPYTGQTGRLWGQVINAQTRAPIPNALIVAGGDRVLSASDGSFAIDLLGPGEQNVVVYATDGSFAPFQQGAIIVSGATTPAYVEVNPSPLVNVTFRVTPPEGTTPGLPVRLIGNIEQLGNTFADLDAGLSTVAARAPLMELQADGRYQLTLALPAGLDLRYKYSQGDGFWNAEQTLKGHFRVRQLIVPATDAVIDDTVDTWTAGDRAPVTFVLQAPETTPAGDIVSIQFNPYDWTPAIPMWPVGVNQWVFVLNSPLHMLGDIAYRYCRNDQCGRANAISDQEAGAPERIFSGSAEGQTFEDSVSAWADWQPTEAGAAVVPAVNPRGEDFVAGVEFETSYHPGIQPYYRLAMEHIAAIQANWVVLTPAWTYAGSNPPALDALPGRTPSWRDSLETVRQAATRNLRVTIFPQTNTAGDPAAYWQNLSQAGWDQAWFEAYSRFLLHYADLAQQAGASALIVGENGSQAAQATVSATRWTALLDQIHARFDGQVLWALAFTGESMALPAWADEIDGIYLQWRAPVAASNDPTVDEMALEFGRLLDEQVLPGVEGSQLPIILALTVPSVDGVMLGATGDAIDLQEQADIVSAAFMAVNEREWIDGFVSQGYYPPAALQDRSASVHGKPAADQLWYWFPRFLGTINP